MKKHHIFQTCLLALLVMGLMTVARDARGTAQKADTDAAETNLVPAELPAPQSVFDISRPYKDPFFPNSNRRRNPVVTTNAPAVLSAAEFVLKGLSGVPGQEVAIINNRNLATGERGEVTLSSAATVWITVTRIDHYSVTFLADGQHEPITISLPKDDQ
jgi:hypothetical protein